MTMTQPMQVLTSHKTVEWYTPPRIIEMVREVLGGIIDLDPASDERPQEWIKAKRIYHESGLRLPWQATTVFCNPPYGKSDGRSSQALWAKKMISVFQRGGFKQGILLINSAHGYRWYEELWVRYPVCLARERIRFIRDDGTIDGRAKKGQTFVYFGQDAAKFIEVFSQIGRVICP